MRNFGHNHDHLLEIYIRTRREKTQEGIVCLLYLKERLLYLKQEIFFYLAVLVSVLGECVHVCKCDYTCICVCKWDRECSFLMHAFAFLGGSSFAFYTDDFIFTVSFLTWSFLSSPFLTFIRKVGRLMDSNFLFDITEFHLY